MIGTSIRSSSSSSAWSRSAAARWRRSRAAARTPSTRACRPAPARPRRAPRTARRGLARQRRVGRQEPGPAVLVEAADVPDRGRQRQVRRRVARCPASRTRRGTAAGPGRSSFAPWDTTSGWIRSRRSARTWSRPEPFGPHSHLWPLPVQYAAPSAPRSRSTMPGRVRAVDERVHAAPVELADDRGDRQDERGGGGDLAHQREPRPRRSRPGGTPRAPPRGRGSGTGSGR